jgi:hypothetical protein
MKKFEEAAYYTCDDDAEELSQETPAEAIVDWMDRMADGQPIAEQIARMFPLTVYAHARDKVTEAWMHAQADSLAEDFEEQFGQEYGDPDGDTNITKDSRAALAMAFNVAIAQLVKVTPVWRCSQVAERTYSAEEVEAILREHVPEWFEAAP